MRPFDIVVAMDLDRGIGKRGKLPWHLPDDLRHFKEITTATQDKIRKNAVIMGRRTWESIPEKFRPLSERINCILSKKSGFPTSENVLHADSLEQALFRLSEPPLSQVVETVFVIGGGQVYEEAVQNEHCRRIYLTQILSKFNCDTFFPDFQRVFKQVAASPHSIDSSLEYYFAVFQRVS